MPTLVCNTCNAEFSDEKVQKSHYRSDWHQYNLKRKLAGAPGVSEALFNFRLETLAAEKGRLDSEHLLYTCSVCNKEYRSRKAHAQHLQSKLHIQKASRWLNSSSDPFTLTRPVPSRPVKVENFSKAQVFEHVKLDAHGSCQFQVNGNSSDEWEEVNDVDDVVSLDSCELEDFHEKQCVESGNLTREDTENWVPNQCLFCDSIPDGTIEGCVQHMHKQHGFFIPDAEYLTDPRGLLRFLGVKVTKDFMCLYCEDRGKQFSSLEAVRKHMISKSHCKLRYGDEGQEGELEDFYDFNSSYVPEEDAQLVSAGERTAIPVSLSAGGAELLIKYDTGTKTIGSREFLRYYRQKPRPSEMHDGDLVDVPVTRHQGMGLCTNKQSQDRICNHRETRKSAHFQADALQMKLGIKNNVLTKLPRNVPY